MDFSSLQPVDSHGVPISAYVLSFNRGSLTNPLPWGQSVFVDIMFGLYKAIAWFSLMLLNLVSSFDWLSPFVNLLEQVSDTITNRLGAAGVLLMAIGVLAAIAGVNWMRQANHRTLYHLGLAVVLFMVAVAMVSPVRLAGHALGLGRDVGTEVGAAAADTPSGSSLSTILADKLVREPTQRWNFGHDLDSLGCGDSWSSKILSGNQDAVKDAAYACPGGQALHDYAMMPLNPVYDGFFAIGCIAVFAAFSIALMVRMLTTGFSTVMHASAVKPLTFLVPAGAAVQNLYVRNALAIGLGSASIGLDVLIFIVAASFTAGMALLTGSGAEASVITALAMVGIVLGARRFAANLRNSRHQIAARVTNSQGPAPLASTVQPAKNLARQVIATKALGAVAPGISPLALAGARAASSAAKAGRTNGASPQLAASPARSASTHAPSTPTARASRAASAVAKPTPGTGRTPAGSTAGHASPQQLPAPAKVSASRGLVEPAPRTHAQAPQPVSNTHNDAARTASAARPAASPQAPQQAPAAPARSPKASPAAPRTSQAAPTRTPQPRPPAPPISADATDIAARSAATVRDHRPPTGSA
ncbi:MULTISPECIES: hypothetical protein [Mycolicibacterium]|uniref:Uncharacterized protein n=1 Tax=Mycolicibacterium alvei TaxID=67081 RepID=A0A6N4V2B7_9MYCO|nr:MULTISPECIES: hypothetical protein [Mycolicibacterium]OBG12276.1 hypothetical protein A5768_11155 [Mycolicibacterium fortuitum]BBX30688.1 hypothetical protein MALV_58130 [Mycolicibacterium alvei]